MRRDLTNLVGNAARDYRQRRYRGLDQKCVNWREQQVVAKLLTQCRLTGGTLLDVPCGYGRFTPLFAHLGISAIGADKSIDMLELATETHFPHGRERWLQANILALPFAEDTFDCALCIRLLHHPFSDAERQRILRELARVARRFVVISFYRLTTLHALARRSLNPRWPNERRRLGMMTIPQLQVLAQSSGLQIQQVRSVLLFCHAQTFVVLAKNSGAPDQERPSAYANAPSD
jgi:ubiquinone/menaquinone biosynthesis C-methylase UbiE